jgi:hypothetical protein
MYIYVDKIFVKLCGFVKNSTKSYVSKHKIFGHFPCVPKSLFTFTVYINEIITNNFFKCFDSEIEQLYDGYAEPTYCG